MNKGLQLRIASAVGGAVSAIATLSVYKLPKKLKMDSKSDFLKDLMLVPFSFIVAGFVACLAGMVTLFGLKHFYPEEKQKANKLTSSLEKEKEEVLLTNEELLNSSEEKYTDKWRSKILNSPHSKQIG